MHWSSCRSPSPRRRLLLGGLAGAVVAGGVAGGAAAGAAAVPAASTPAAQASPGRLRFGYFDRYAPLSERTADGHARGELVQRVAAVMQAAGLQAEHLAFPWTRAQAMVATEQLDGFCTQATPERERYAQFAQELLLVDPAVLAHRRNDARPATLRQMDDLNALRLGSYRGDGSAQLALSGKLRRFDDSPDSVLRRIALGDLDGFVEGAAVLEQRVQRLGLGGQLRITRLGFVPAAQFRIGLRHGLPAAAELLQRLDAATLQLRRSGQLPLGFSASASAAPAAD